MSGPRVITETITREWVPVPGADPRQCRCGHLHYPRVAENFAPQWSFCEGNCPRHSRQAPA